MKIRNGFVSNSSSSSFVIGVVKEGEKCPCCGRGVDSVQDLFNKSDTKINWYDVDEEIDELKSDVEAIKDQIHTYTSEKEVKWAKEELKEIQHKIKVLQELKQKCKYVIGVEIDNYDDLTFQELSILQKNKQIIIKES